MDSIKETYIYDGKLFLVRKLPENKNVTYDFEKDDDVAWFTYTSNLGYFGQPQISAAITTYDNKGQKTLFSTGPWWVDSNHVEPGMETGNLSLLFILTATPQPPWTRAFCPQICYPQLHGMKIQGSLRGANIDLKGAELVFWCQFKNPDTQMNYNYVLSGQPLTQYLLSGETEDFELNLDCFDDAQWTALGACERKKHLYQKGSIRESISNCDIVNMGFIVSPFPLNYIWQDKKPEQALEQINQTGDYWPVDTSQLPQGTVALSKLKITFNTEYEVSAK